MNGLTKHRNGLVFYGKRRKPVEKEAIHQHRNQMFWVCGAQGHVDNRGQSIIQATRSLCSLQIELDSNGATRIGMGGLPATVYRATANADDSLCMRCRMLNYVGSSFFCYAEGIAVPAFHQSPFYEEEIPACFDGLLFCQLQ